MLAGTRAGDSYPMSEYEAHVPECRIFVERIAADARAAELHHFAEMKISLYPRVPFRGHKASVRLTLFICL